MADSSSSTNPPAAGSPSESTPTTTFYQQLASKIASAVLETAAQIPGYSDDMFYTASTARRVASRKFVEMALSAVQSSEELTGVRQLDAAQVQDDLQFAQAFQPLADVLIGVAKRLGLMIRVKEAKTGRNALGSYNIAKRVALNPNNTQLAVHVENLKAELKRKRKQKSASPDTPVASAGGGAPTK